MAEVWGRAVGGSIGQQPEWRQDEIIFAASLCSSSLLQTQTMDARIDSRAPSVEGNDNADINAPLKAAPKLVAPEPGISHSLISPPFAISFFTFLISLRIRLHFFPSSHCFEMSSQLLTPSRRTLPWSRIAKRRQGRCLRRLSKPANLRYRSQRPRSRHSPHHRPSCVRQAQDSRPQWQGRRRQVHLHHHARPCLRRQPGRPSRHHGHGYLRAQYPQDDGS